MKDVTHVIKSPEIPILHVDGLSNSVCGIVYREVTVVILESVVDNVFSKVWKVRDEKCKV